MELVALHRVLDVVAMDEAASRALTDSAEAQLKYQ